MSFLEAMMGMEARVMRAGNSRVESRPETGRWCETAQVVRCGRVEVTGVWLRARKWGRP
jgi:hypothetical protein